MPEDWDDEMDGEWEPPMIPNPDYKVDNCHLLCVKYTLSLIYNMFTECRSNLHRVYKVPTMPFSSATHTCMEYYTK